MLAAPPKIMKLQQPIGLSQRLVFAQPSSMLCLAMQSISTKNFMGIGLIYSKLCK